jgi:hypothetical protein
VIDIEPIRKSLLENIASLKQKDIFKLFSLEDKEIEDKICEWLLTNFFSLMPEEIILAVNRFSTKTELKTKALEYLE